MAKFGIPTEALKYNVMYAANKLSVYTITKGKLSWLQ